MKTFLRKAPKVILFVLIVVFAYALLDVLYLFALNGRYENLGNKVVLDKWSRMVYYADEYNGLKKERSQRNQPFKSPFWRFEK